MIKSFKDKGSYEVARGLITKRTRKLLPLELHRRAVRLLAELDFARTLKDISRPSNRLHALTGNRKGQYSISINRQFRICFYWQDGEANDVEIVDYH